MIGHFLSACGVGACSIVLTWTAVTLVHVDIAVAAQRKASCALLDIALGRVNKFGHANSYPWHDEIGVSPTELVIKPDQAASGGGSYDYDLYIEYMSSHAGGKLVKIMENQVDQHSFAY